ncbi:MAG TPA: DUF1294 domain-containing protein [Sphingobium sp.]
MDNAQIVIFLYALAINLAGFTIFAMDKERARNGARRIRERDLLALAVVGGSVGAVLGQQILRHKTRKEPFRTYLQIIIIAQIGLIFGFLLF